MAEQDQLARGRIVARTNLEHAIYEFKQALSESKKDIDDEARKQASTAIEEAAAWLETEAAQNATPDELKERQTSLEKTVEPLFTRSSNKDKNKKKNSKDADGDETEHDDL